MANPFQAIDRRVVRRVFRAIGSRDPDVLRANKGSLLRMARVPRIAGVLAMVLGCVLAANEHLAGGAIAAAVGIWLWSRGTRSAAAIEAGYADFLRTPED